MASTGKPQMLNGTPKNPSSATNGSSAAPSASNKGTKVRRRRETSPDHSQCNGGLSEEDEFCERMKEKYKLGALELSTILGKFGILRYSLYDIIVYINDLFIQDVRDIFKSYLFFISNIHLSVYLYKTPVY